MSTLARTIFYPTDRLGVQGIRELARRDSIENKYFMRMLADTFQTEEVYAIVCSGQSASGFSESPEVMTRRCQELLREKYIELGLASGMHEAEVLIREIENQVASLHRKK